MRDEHITTPAALSPSESAVLYLLKRMTVDADLRYHMLHTEAFGRLCEAEAQRTGKDASAIEKKYSELAAHCRDDKPKLVLARNACSRALEAAHNSRKACPVGLSEVRMDLDVIINALEGI